MYLFQKFHWIELTSVFKFHPDCRYFMPFHYPIILHCVHTPHFVYPFIHSRAFERLPLLGIRLQWASGYKILCDAKFHFFGVSVYLGCVLTLCLTFEELANSFWKWLQQFTLPSAVNKSPQHLLLLLTATLVDANSVLAHCGFDSHFPGDKGCWASFQCWSVTCIASLEKCPFKAFTQLLKIS